MFLKQLEINGFKSFLGKSEISFTKGINAIVGPNGSGKSNIADAIRWVIGEQSVKTLRGNKMEDVIFAGSEKMKAAGYAEVTLILDNTDKGIDLEFNEISITRRMYRSGESEYYINKSQCRLKDITEMFMDTGVGRDGYTIIGQGKIDEILSNKSEDRRAIFEEAAGISKYKYRKLESEKKMEQTEENIVRIQDIAKEVENQLLPIKEQADITRSYKKMLHELKTLEVNLLIINIDRNNNKLDRLKNDIELSNRIHNEKKESLLDLENSLEKNKINLKKIDCKIVDSGEEIHETINYRDKLDGELRINKEKSIYTNTTLERMKNENETLIKDKNNVEIDIEINEKAQKVLNNNLQEVDNEIKNIELEYNEKYSTIIEMESKIKENKEEEIRYINEESEIKSKVSALNEILKNIDIRIKEIKFNNNLLLNQNNEKDILKGQLENDLTTISAKLAEKRNKEKELVKKKNDIKDQVLQIEKTLIEKRSNSDNILSRLGLLEEMEREYGGYNKTIKNILTKRDTIKNMVSGFRGVIGELITVPEEYAIAIEAALGFTMQNIVTDSEEDAKRLIEFLKKNKMGRATFLPISSIKPKSIFPNELKRLKIPGFIGIGADLIKYENKYKNIIYYLLGRIAIVDSLDTAIKLNRIFNNEIKIVTIEGDIISVGGAITGGSKSPLVGSILSRKSQILELKKKYKIISKKLEELDKILYAKKTNIYELDKNISSTTEEIHSLEMNYANAENQLKYINSELELIKSKLVINNKDIEELDKEKERNQLLIDESNKRLTSIAINKNELLEILKTLEENVKKTIGERDIFIKGLTDLKIKEAELKQKENSLKKRTLDLLNNMHNINSKININLEMIEDNKNTLSIIEGKVNEINDKIGQLENRLGVKQKEFDESKEEKVKLLEAQETMEKQIKECQNEISKIKDNLYKIDLQKTKSEMEIENYLLKLLDSYDLNYNKALAYKVDDFVISKSTKRVDELKENIKGLGSVNVNAIEEHERLNKRYNFLLSQLKDLETAKESLNTVIKDITAYMKKQFMEEFQKINKNFNDVFVKLFGGGRAELVLSEKENILESGIDIIVKPPNKKTQNLMLMSGGERALTAIALLFGILLMKPVPFCVLDEIDSALDDANVKRYAAYLKELSNYLQFIIITHRKGSMEMADYLYGVSMEDTGASTLLSVRFEDKVS